MNLAVQFGVGAIGLIVFFLIINNEDGLNGLLGASITGANKEIAALQGR